MGPVVSGALRSNCSSLSSPSLFNIINTLQAPAGQRAHFGIRLAGTLLFLEASVMASELECGGEELGGSLFEGMVLFSPSDLLPPDLPREKYMTSPAPVSDPVRLPPQRPASPSQPRASSTGVAPSSESKPQPLDENLFSDLTLQNPVGATDPAPSPSPSPISRQISRKKKRAVRIGYGREVSNATLVITADDPPRSIEDSAPAIAVEDYCRPSPDSSDCAPSTPRLHEELPGRSQQEEVAETSGAAAAVHDDGIASRLEDHRGYAESVLSTSEASGKEDNLRVIEEKLELLRARISVELDGNKGMAATVYAERKELERRRRQALEDVNQAATSYTQLEMDLEEACEAEDFETAEKVSENLAASEKDKDRLLSALREVELDCDSVDSRMQEVLKLQIAAEEEGVKLLEQLSEVIGAQSDFADYWSTNGLVPKDAADCADLIHQNAEELSLKELKYWHASMEALEMNKLEKEIESDLISEARSALQCSIEDLVKDDRKEVEKLMKKRNTLAKELDELLRLVSLKEKEIAENNTQIHEVERKISEVASEFQQSQVTVGVKHDNFRSAVAKIESQREALLTKRKEIDEFISLEEQKFSKLKEIASLSSDEAKTHQNLVDLRKNLASSFLKSREDKIQLVKTEEKIMEDIQMLRQQISTGRTTLQELSSTRGSIQQEISSFKQRIAFIDERGPELEAEKKVAAAARNFKEASRIASEAKMLNSENVSLQDKMEKAALDLEKLDEDIKNIVSKMQENEKLISMKEKEAAIAGSKRLRLVAAAARAERSAALEMGDSEEAEFLLNEAEAAEARARELQEEFELDLGDHGNSNEKLFVSIALITSLAGKQLAEMAAALRPSAAGG
ncbi:hypothetical protein AXF42_Ash020429 [Apostasia shenzhenica]|uniref:UVR domain-containing protein n=1 Tax=Apostasia shenzhenica TaxID=1088818 RepID=A0A2H9ZYK0_9ASPA|nr:hypothetical protein AXF42_Ash020429 [Apostasia shenzhenica]